MQKILTLLTVLLASLCSSPIQGEIIETEEIADLLKHYDEETLVILDLNNTLMEISQDLGSNQWAAYKVQEEMTTNGLSNKAAWEAFIPTWNRVLIASRVCPVEKKTVAIVHHLQMQGVQLMGLSSREVEMAYPTQEDLHSIDIDLSRSTVYHLHKEVLGGRAAKFIHGTLFVGWHNDKGKTLFRFLDQIGYRPKNIVFVDDKLENLQSVEKLAKKRRIPFKGIRYGYRDEKKTQFNPTIAEKQWEHFNQVIPDEEAEKLLAFPLWKLVHGGVR